MKRWLLLPLEFAVVTLALVWLWETWGRDLYVRHFMRIATVVFAQLDLPAVRPGAAQQRFVSFVPFLGLMIVTPRLSLARRCLGTLVGAVAIFASHLTLVATRFVADDIEDLFPAVLLVIAMPFLLWAIIAHDVLFDRVVERA